MNAYSVRWLIHLLIVAQAAGTPCRTAPEAVRIVEPAVIALLPETLRTFFSAHQSKWVTLAATDALQAEGDRTAPASRHYIALEALADRGALATMTPLRMAEALRRFEQRGIADGGRLPWVLLDACRELSVSFRDGRRDRIMQASAAVLHYSIDANSPFNTALVVDNQHGGGVGRPAGEVSAEPDLDDSDWKRLQVDLLRTHADRLAFEVRVWPERLRDVPDRHESVWRALRSALAARETLLAIDRDVIAALGIDDESAPEARERYGEALARRALPVMEKQLESAALLTAALITSAWSEAGRPALAVQGTTAESTPAPAPTQAASVAAFVGSQSSQVFHRPTCRHVKRIRPDNLVQFSSADEATKAGRRPCKTCSPQP